VNANEAVRALVEAVPEALFVASLGTATSALREVSGDGAHLYMGGAMGSALAVALGVAAKRPERRVVAVLGDGETLMGAGSLWTLAAAPERNVTAVVLSDGHYTITGGQPLGVDPAFARVGTALGLEAAVASSPAEIAAALAGPGLPALLEIHYDERVWPGPSPFVDPPVVRWRFENAASGAA
jgi:thiamine pyrophosphate-dependent acetolactate synthase large subunit-like protein